MLQRMISKGEIAIRYVVISSIEGRASPWEEKQGENVLPQRHRAHGAKKREKKNIMMLHKKRRFFHAPNGVCNKIARHFSVWYRMDLFPPATQWVFDPLPATEVAGYHMAPIKGATGAKQGENSY
ncbi:MAG: hypothetical protein K0B81_06280 [Candidatus Cloacimonetes bacterium]|nr:hypothetical protein [Candidatus Cloacimonadota bacterium]